MKQGTCSRRAPFFYLSIFFRCSRLGGNKHLTSFFLFPELPSYFCLFFASLSNQVPPESVVESLNMVFNNVSMQNLDVKVSETKAVLKPAHVAWFGNYLVVKLSTQPNFHALYLAFLLKLDSPGLVAAVLAAAFHNVSKLLGSQKITTSSSERSVLKNLGSWLGQMTLARNRPIMQRKLDVKELLCQGYETGRLIAVTPFVAKVMEGAKDSRVFRPPNPWTMALMGLLRELYEMNDLKMNIKFEIEVLCKHLSLKIDDVPPLCILGYARLQPHKDKTPDFNVRPSALSQQQQAAAVAAERHKGGNVHDSGDAGGVLAGQQQQPQVQPQQQQALPVNNNLQLPPPQGASAGAPLGLPPPSSGGAGASGSGDATSGLAGLPSGLGVGVVPSEQTVIPNLGAYVTVHPSLSVFHGPNGGALKAVVPVAVDRAIRDIIQPVHCDIHQHMHLPYLKTRTKLSNSHVGKLRIDFCFLAAHFFLLRCFTSPHTSSRCFHLPPLKTGGRALGDHCLHHHQGARGQGLCAGRLGSENAQRGAVDGLQPRRVSRGGDLQRTSALEHGYPTA